MDPNETLATLSAAIEAAKRYQANDTDHPSYCVVPNYTVTEIIDGFEALNAWLMLNGFMPERWYTPTGR